MCVGGWNGPSVYRLAPFDVHRIGIGGGDMPVLGDVFIQLDVHETIFLESMHLARLCFPWLKKAKRFGNGHLIDKDLSGDKLGLGSPGSL